MRCATGSSRRSFFARLVEQTVEFMPRAGIACVVGCTVEHVAQAQQLGHEAGPPREVEPLECAPSVEGGSAGLPERTGTLRADPLPARRSVEGAGRSHATLTPTERRWRTRLPEDRSLAG